MLVGDVLVQLGGVATRRQILEHVSPGHLRGALSRGEVVRDARGRYALASADDARRAAQRLDGVLGGLSAAVAHGWKVARTPERPVVVVPRKRHLPAHRRCGVEVRWLDLAPHEASHGVVNAVTAVTQSARWLPFDEALAVADSALRSGDLAPETLIAAAAEMPRQHVGRVTRIARAADGRAANPFESVLRAIALDVEGLQLEPQYWVTSCQRSDLVDPVLRIVVEADSYEIHGRSAAAFHRDCVRYNGFICDGWLVLRFSWYQVMFEQDAVREVLEQAVLLRRATRTGSSPRSRRERTSRR